MPPHRDLGGTCGNEALRFSSTLHFPQLIPMSPPIPGPSLRNPAVQEVHMQSKQRDTHLVEKHPRCFALNFKQHM